MAVVDTHVHIFRRGLPLAPVRRYVPDYDATIEDYRERMAANGISHAVIVQPSFLGTDNSYMCDALRRHRSQLRGIAVVDPAASEEELSTLNADGVAGIRFNLEGLPVPDFALDPWPRLFGFVRQLDWVVQVQRNARDLPGLIGPLLDAGVKVLVDHFGRPDDDLGIADPAFGFVLAQAPTRRVWVKLSAPYRNGTNGRGLSTAPKAAALLLERFGSDRLVWGSDWPHTNHESDADIPSAQRQLEKWIPDLAAREHLSGPSALALFQF